MRKLIYIIIFLIVIFIVNLIFYSVSEDYRFFLKKMKDSEQVVYLEEKKYDDIIKVDEIDETEEEEDIEKVHVSNKNEAIFVKKEEVELRNEVSLWKSYIEVLDLFSVYKLIKLDVNSHLFDLTDEYPDNYFEYYSKDLTVYLFPTKTYSEVYDIFSVLSDELPYTINEVNNFWDNSFYINLNDDIADKFVRIIIWNKWIVFGLKIKKTEYSLVKEKLNSLKILPENTPESSSWTTLNEN